MIALLYLALAAVSFGCGIWLGYRVATVPRSGEPLPFEHDLFI